MNVLDRGAAAHRAGDFATAERLYRETVACAWQNLAVLNIERRDFPAAERQFRLALDADPDHALSAFGLGVHLLSLGRYAEGWSYYEARRVLHRAQMPTQPKTAREWMGEDLAGRRLLVLGEQGFGDQIMFGRFLAALSARGADVTFGCAPELVSLMPRAASQIDASQFDYWCYLGTVPLRLGVTLQSLPPPLPIGGGPGAGGGGVGVVPAGRPDHPNDANRSLDPASATALLALGRDLRPAATGARSFEETAEIVAGLDLVITVDTAIAHLAGSMGKPTWVLLPRLNTDWRWGIEGAATPWYPSLRLFRQPRPGDWGSVLAEVNAALS